MTATESVIGILAHVDAGKTSLSEQIIYRAGLIRKIGRVDSKDTCLDFYEQERARGITIFSKQTKLNFNSRSFTLIDTPGHADFSAETERALSVLDAAILVVDGVEGVQSQTAVWWDLLKEKQIPTFIFVSKNDRDTADKSRVMTSINEYFGSRCYDFTTVGDETAAFEDIVSLDEKWLEKYFDGTADSSLTAEAVDRRLAVPVVFGSALTGDGVDRLLELLCNYTVSKEYPDEFSAKVYKVTFDKKGELISFIKVTGGTLNAKDEIGNGKINQIRIYAGEKFELASSVAAGCACGVTGLSETFPGQIIGSSHEKHHKFTLHPALITSVTSADTDTHTLITDLRLISREMPELSVKPIRFGSREEIQIGVMGKIQLEVLADLVKSRFGIEIQFGTCRINYKETVSAPVFGYGHYEPLRHYAETHLKIEPAPRGSGIIIANECSLEMLDGNFQNLILTHIGEKEHIGILTGSPLTDVKITLVAGRSHLKHTEGGDFREATYRAVRQGLEKAENILLEPYYDFTLKIPADCIGRALNDVQKMCCEFEAPESGVSMAVIKGRGPVATLLNYAEELASYTKGKGVVIFTDAGYFPCHNTDEVISSIGYEKERDLDNPSSSVFCSHGAGFEVKWQDVDSMRHIK